MKTSTPCIRNCCLDFDDICMGCFRSLEEIKTWSKLSEPERKRLMEILPERKRQREKFNLNQPPAEK